MGHPVYIYIYIEQRKIKKLSVLRLDLNFLLKRCVCVCVCVYIYTHLFNIYIYTHLFNKKSRSSLSTESFLIFLFFCIVMKTIVYCISNVIRYYIFIVIRQGVEYKFPIEKVCFMKKNTGIQYSLKSIGTVENPIYY